MANMFLPGLLMAVVLIGILDLGLGTKMCTPQQWEGDVRVYGEFLQDFESDTWTGHRKIYYDAKNTRRTDFVSYNVEGIQHQFQIIEIYSAKSGSRFVYNLKDGTCSTQHIPHPFELECIPETAKEMNNYNLGLKTKAYGVTTYTAKEKGLVTRKIVMKVGADYIPVIKEQTGNHEGIAFFEATEYGDMAGGISNATVFVIPKACKEEQSFENAEFFLRMRMRSKQPTLF